MRMIDRSPVLADHMLGNTQSETHEGFLLCRDVPIARVGVQQYMNSELQDVMPGTDGVIHVERRAEDVFLDKTISSFEGKPVVDDHPDEPVNPHTFREHVVGITLNVRRGDGALNDLLLADLLIMDADAIAAVRAGKREVSCGYDAQYESLSAGRARQHTIIGNHVALVNRGRCGPRCSIGDEEPEMTKTTDKKVSWFDRAMAAFLTKDEKAFKDAMEEAKEDTKDEESSRLGVESHIHLHTGPNESTTLAPTADKRRKSKDQQDPENEEEEPDSATKDAPKWFKDYATTMDKRMADMKKTLDKAMAKDAKKDDETEEEGEAEAEGNVIDEEGEEEDEPMIDRKKTKDKKKATKDGAPDLAVQFQAVRAGAEILSPGLKLMTFDAAANPKATNDSMCVMRRRAVASYARTQDGAAAIIDLTQRDTLDLKSMTCDSVTALFNGAVAIAKRANNAGAGGGINLRKMAQDQARMAIPNSIHDFNKAKNDFFAKQ